MIGRWTQLAKLRPRWYRAANGIATIIFGVVTWLIASRINDDFLSWTALLALLAAVCLWDARPPRTAGSTAAEGERRAEPVARDNR